MKIRDNTKDNTKKSAFKLVESSFGNEVELTLNVDTTNEIVTKFYTRQLINYAETLKRRIKDLEWELINSKTIKLIFSSYHLAAEVRNEWRKKS